MVSQAQACNAPVAVEDAIDPFDPVNPFVPPVAEQLAVVGTDDDLPLSLIHISEPTRPY